MFSVSDLRGLALTLLIGLTNGAQALELLPEASLGADNGIASDYARQGSLQELDETGLETIQGQAGSLILVDRIGPNELQGAPADGSANFSYYRMGLDAKLDFNANMSKLQLGCGGVNDLLITSRACDIDIDYLSFMGINAAGNAPGAAGSPFQMKRPFIEVAVKNENDPVKREVVGIRIGAQSINGALGIGREYTTNGINLENPSGPACNTSATVGSGVVGCHSGVNSLSGFLSLELSAAMGARANVLGFTTDINTCLGRMTPSKYGCNAGTTPFFVEAKGTRLSTLHVAAAKLNIDNIDLNCNIINFIICAPAQVVANSIVSQGYGQLKIDMRAVHYLLAPNTQDFFLAFGRQPVSWPNYSKTLPPNNVAFDACNPAYGQATARCSSAYAPRANTGWWLNAPGVKILNIAPPDRLNVGNVDLGTVLSLLGPEGQLIIDNPKIGLPRPDNCHGTSVFC